MFDIGFTEIIIICLVGLIVIGPSRLPEALRTGAMWLGRGKRMLGNVRRDLENEIGIDEIRRDLRNEQIMSEIKAENLEEDRQRQLKEQQAEQQTEQQHNAESDAEAQPDMQPLSEQHTANKKQSHTNSYLDRANNNGAPTADPQSETSLSAVTDNESHRAEQNKKNP